MSDQPFQSQSREQFWLTHIQRAREQGIRYVDYARQHDLNLGTLYSWSKRFKHVDAVPTPSSAFAAVKVVDAPGACRCRFPNGITLELDAPQDAAALCQLLTQLSRLP